VKLRLEEATRPWWGAVALVRRSDLDALAKWSGTDKSSRRHGYTRWYATHLGPRRRAVTSVLEIGVGGTTSTSGFESRAGGASLRMWRRWFPRARVVGVDLHAKDVGGDRIVFEQGDQADPLFLARLAATYGPFDVVIDDGSHLGRHVRASFAGLWAAVKPGGWYVIEDLQTASDPRWEGGPPGTPGTSAELLKTLVDDTLARTDPAFRPSVAALHVYAEIAFLRKPTQGRVPSDVCPGPAGGIG
jgi:hypothetical protein